jgi:hypothetical protein
LLLETLTLKGCTNSTQTFIQRRLRIISLRWIEPWVTLQVLLAKVSLRLLRVRERVKTQRRNCSKPSRHSTTATLLTT